MSGPRSLRAALAACQPLKRSLLPHAATRSIYRSFCTSGNPHLAEPSLSPSEVPPNPNDHQPPLEPSINRNLNTGVADESPSSPSAPSLSSVSPQRRQSHVVRAPRSVQASYLRPLRHAPIDGHPVCSLQLRSFSARNVEFMADFAMRAAYYLKLPAKGPVPLPKIVQRWTVLKSNFVHKKCQENFERITLRRLIQIQDGDSEVVKIWLAYLRRYAFWGVGMKANVWEFEGLDVGANMDKAYAGIEKELEEKLSFFGWKSTVANRKSVPDWLRSQDRVLPGVPMTDLRRGSQTKQQPHKTESVY